MAKIIKKIVRIIFLAAAALLLLSLTIFLLLQIPAIQTYAVNRVSRLLTEKSGAEITVGRVSYSLRHDIILERLLVRDQHRDTLLAAARTELRIREIRPKHGRFRFGRIALYEPDFRMVTDSAGLLNLNWFINSLEGGGERDTLKRTDIRFASITLTDGSYTLADMLDTAGVTAGTVNFRNMHIDSINARVRDLRIIPDSVSMVIRELSFREQGGFTAEEVGMNLAVTGNNLSFREVEVSTASTRVSAEKLIFMPNGPEGWQDFINEVRLDFHFNPSTISSSDLSYFVQPVQGMHEMIDMSGRISGTVAEMKGRNMRLDYGSSTRLRFDFDISGLPAIDESFIYIGFTEMRTHAADIEHFSLPGVKAFIIPEVVHDLGVITFRGSFTGFTTDFVSFGKFTTERGTIDTDISLRPAGRNTFSFKGALQTSDVDLGHLARNEEMFGGLWGHAEIDGSTVIDRVTRKFTRLNANINGVIDSVEINRYLYRNIDLAGTYSEKIWDGSVEIREPNIDMSLLGRFDLERERPEFDFTMNLAGADLMALNLVRHDAGTGDTASARGIAALFRSRPERDSVFRASALVTANFSGNRIDNIEGTLRLINSTFENSGGILNIYDLLISSDIVRDVPLLTVRSDFADAAIRGRYTIDALREGVSSMLAALIPSRFSGTTARQAAGQPAADITFELTAKRVDRLNEFFRTGVTISPGSRATGTLRSDTPEMTAEMTADLVTAAGLRLKNLHMSSGMSGGRMNLRVQADTLRLPDQSRLGGFSLTGTGWSDTIRLTAGWDNGDEGRNRGEAGINGLFSRSRPGKATLTLALLPGEMTVNNMPWSISPARIVIDSTSALFENVIISHGDDYVSLGGRISEVPDDKFDLGFSGLNLAYLNRVLKQENMAADATPMVFEGRAGGRITLSDIYRNLLFESLINIEEFRLNNNDYGLMTISSEWDPRRRVIMLSAGNDFHGTRSISVQGIYSPHERLTELTATASSLPLDVINPIVRSFASDVRGLGTGTIRLRVAHGQIQLTGAVMARDASLKIDFLQTRYSFTDSIRFTPAGISFRNIRIYDEKRNFGTINGMITHKSFKDIGVSLDINIDRMMVLNTRAKDSDIFYGTAYASGYAGIRGNEEKLSFNISARTAPNTEFYIPLNTSASVSDYPYIVFTAPGGADPERDKELDMVVRPVRPEESAIEVNLDLEVTPEAEVQLLLDEVAGDVIRGKGEGKLNISLSPRGDVRLAGNYVIREGDYLFTLGNILNKRFAIESGGTVSWNGAIEDATLNIKALYKTKASLSEIFGDHEFTDLKAKIPVECILSLSDKLFNPAVSFDIALPTADETSRELLRAAVDNEEKMSRQFLYLLVMNSFYPDPALYNSGATAGAQMGRTGLPLTPGVGVTTTTEMLSNQLSNWLSQISNDFDIGFSYRPGNELTDQEMEVALSTQLLNDKVVLNGNVDLRGNQSNTQASNISGEFTVEVRLTDRLRFKVFNRSNYNLYYQMHPYTQGVGLFFRRDFNRLPDLFTASEEKKKKDRERGDENSGK